jgi:nitroreductase
MNPALTHLFGRRSIRKYADREVPGEMIHDLLEAAMAAPSACAKDPWRIVVVQNKQTLQRIADALPYGKMLPGAGVGLVVCGELAEAHDGQLSYLLQDVSAAIENILLAAHALGLGGCWLGVHPREDRMAAVAGVVNLPEGFVPVSVVSIGWPAEERKARTRFDQSKVRWESW